MVGNFLISFVFISFLCILVVFIKMWGITKENLGAAYPSATVFQTYFLLLSVPNRSSLFSSANLREKQFVASLISQKFRKFYLHLILWLHSILKFWMPGKAWGPLLSLTEELLESKTPENKNWSHQSSFHWKKLKRSENKRTLLG